jgi:phage terminase large subunit GpA-like protein
VSDPKSRNSGNTILLKTYPGGSLAIVGANSPAGLAGRPRRVVLLDEVDRFPASAGTEGDPCVLAERRTESFWNPVIIRCSSPTLLRASRIDQAMELTDCRQWQVQCPRCQGAQVLAWRQVRWPEDKPEEAWLECDHCQARLTDAERVAMVRAGQWQATKPFNGHRGYHLNGINSPFPHKRGYSNRLHQMAAEFLEAKAGGRQTLKPWVNTFLAESWQEEGFSMELSALAGRAEDYGPTLPAGVLLVTASVDVQADRLEYEITGWGFGQERWGIEYRVLPGVTTQPTVWAELDAILLRGAWTTADGRRLTVTIATIDSAGFTDHVHAFCKPRFHRRVFAIRGSNQPGQPIAGLPSRANRLRCPVFRVGTDTAKRLIFDRLQLTKPGPGTFHWPKDTAFGFDDQYFSMLTAEEIRIVYHKGFQRYEWHKTRPRNEALDITVYSFAAVQILRPNWEALAGHEPGAAPPEPPSAGDLTPTPPRAPRPAPRPAPWSRRAPNPWNRRKWR